MYLVIVEPVNIKASKFVEMVYAETTLSLGPWIFLILIIVSCSFTLIGTLHIGGKLIQNFVSQANTEYIVDSDINIPSNREFKLLPGLYYYSVIL